MCSSQPPGGAPTVGGLWPQPYSCSAAAKAPNNSGSSSHWAALFLPLGPELLEDDAAAPDEEGAPNLMGVQGNSSGLPPAIWCVALALQMHLHKCKCAPLAKCYMGRASCQWKLLLRVGKVLGQLRTEDTI